MAVLENINHQPMEFESSSCSSSHYGFKPNKNRKGVASFPHIFFSDGEPWSVANKYALYRYYDLSKDIKTVHREMSHLARYADWLEQTNLHWLHFPKKKSERCLFRFRGYLIELRDEGIVAPSTTTQVMNSVVAFYRWAAAYKHTDDRSSMFDDQTKVISFFDKVGFSRTMSVISSELSIPNRKRTGVRLEGGLTPLSRSSSIILMNHLAQHSNYELYLMTKTALQTGCRHETITTLNISALECAYPDKTIANTLRVRVGPGTGVDTKFDVSGEVYFPRTLINELAQHYNSAEATLRRSKADVDLHRNIFLTSHGNQYSSQTFGTLMHRLKQELIDVGHSEFGRFKFHQLRATFGTMLMRALLKTQKMNSLNAIEFVKEALLHKDASTTWKYIQFIEREPVEEQFLDTLWSMFTGTESESNGVIDQIISGNAQ